MASEETAGCLGCAIASKLTIPMGGFIKETEHFLLHQDPAIPIRGFLVITAKRHCRSVDELTPVQLQELSDLCYRARKALRAVCNPLLCTLIQEERSGHFHLWLFPRYAWMDERFDRTLSCVRPIMEFAKEKLQTDANIREVLDTAENLRRFMR